MTTTYSASLKSFLGIEETGPLIVEPVTAASLALQLTTVITTGAGKFTFPRITDDPSTGWIGENTEIPASDAAADELTVIPKKVAGLSIISNELADDSSPEAAATIGKGLARKLAKSIDSAFFGAAPANENVQPGGLEYQGSAVTVIAEAPDEGIDAYIDALATAEDLGIELTAWVCTSAVAKALAKLKVGTGSNMPLFGAGATNGISRNILGLPLYVSPAVLTGTSWGIPKDDVSTILRRDVSLDIDRSVKFTSDQTAIRGIMRLAWGFEQPAGLIKIKAAE